jgi:hypothetical protein
MQRNTLKMELWACGLDVEQLPSKIKIEKVMTASLKLTTTPL